MFDTTFHKYPHIDNLHKVPELKHFATIIATEKIHGTNARIGWINGEYRVGGRNEELVSAHANFGFYDWAIAQKERLIPILTEKFGLESNVIIYGEWYGPKIQKGVNYGSTRMFRAFDIAINGNLLDLQDYLLIMQDLDIMTVPIISSGPYDEEFLMSLRHRESEVARRAGVYDPENTWEGLVLRPPIMLRNKRGDWVMAKFKDEAFEERKSMKKEPLHPVESAEADAFAEEWVTAMRLEHVLQQAHEQGIASDSMRDMGQIIKLMAEDVLRESGTDEEQWKAFHKAVARDTRGLYQKHLEGR